jgi:flavodoxin
MKALVVYDSMYGNTEQIAQAVGVVLHTRADVQVRRMGDIKPEDLAGLSLLVVGSPTHGGRASQKTSVWLKSLPPGSLRGVMVAAFDTRVPLSEVKSPIASFFARLLGYAAGLNIASGLTKLGGTLVVPAEGFGVKDTKGPLTEGETERAQAWARRILTKL